MQRVLIVKMSSLGDVIHTLPALTDAGNALKDVRFDWVVEEGFAPIPAWHPLVASVIPIATRRWRRELRHALFSGQVKAFLQQLRGNVYDYVIDGQGLLKSALVTRLSKGKRVGFSRASAREAISALFYQQRYCISKNEHAITRLRWLFAFALGYQVPTTAPDAGLSLPLNSPYQAPYVVFLHGTTWVTKHWPEDYWVALAKRFEGGGLMILLPWGNEREKTRAELIASQVTCAKVLPRLTLDQIAGFLAHAKAVVAMDTGLGHLAAALHVPTVSLFGPTDPKRSGILGDNQHNLSSRLQCAPCFKTYCRYKGKEAVFPACFATVTPDNVWQILQPIIGA